LCIADWFLRFCERIRRATQRRMEPRYFTPLEAARVLRLNEQYVTKLLREGVIKGHKFGRVWRIPESAIDAWLDATSNQREKDREP
jgi:excisionase family DNA binding protein